MCDNLPIAVLLVFRPDSSFTNFVEPDRLHVMPSNLIVGLVYGVIVCHLIANNNVVLLASVSQYLKKIIKQSLKCHI
jgi:hypothetical protein